MSNTPMHESAPDGTDYPTTSASPFMPDANRSPLFLQCKARWRTPSPEYFPGWTKHDQREDRAFPNEGDPLSLWQRFLDQYWVLYGTSRIRAALTRYLQEQERTEEQEAVWNEGIRKETVCHPVASPGAGTNTRSACNHGRPRDGNGR